MESTRMLKYRRTGSVATENTTSSKVGFCGRLIETLCRQKGINSAVSGQMSFWEYKQREYDKLADVIRENMDMEYLYRVMGLA